MEPTKAELLAMIKEDLLDEENGAKHYRMMADKMMECGLDGFVPILHDMAKEEELHHHYLKEMMEKLEN